MQGCSGTGVPLLVELEVGARFMLYGRGSRVRVRVLGLGLG